MRLRRGRCDWHHCRESDFVDTSRRGISQPQPVDVDPASYRAVANRIEECQQPVQRLSTGRIIRIELVFMRKRWFTIRGKEQGVDANTELPELLSERHRLRQQRIAVAARDEAR